MDRWTEEHDVPAQQLAEQRGAEEHPFVGPAAEYPNAEFPNAEFPNAEFPNAEFPEEPWHPLPFDATDDRLLLPFDGADDRLLPGDVAADSGLRRELPVAERPSRSNRNSRADRKRRRRRSRLVPFVSVLVILILVLTSWALVGKVRSRFKAPDYRASGGAVVQIKVANGDGADNIGATLVAAGVVKSSRAFVNAAKSSGQAADIQPGVYQVHLHSSGKAAMADILNPANRLVSKVAIPEGSTYVQVLQIIEKQTQLPAAALTAALAKVGNLGIPDAFKVTSAEGFLFPATYDFDPGTSADAVLQAMVAKFSDEATALNIVGKAKALNLTPYQVLIIASIAEAEAKFDADRAKVARVIMNRIANGGALQVDATSAYAAKIAGKDPTKVIYATLDSPYNTYTHPGLPPTPIGNPGAAAITSALNPPAGSWLYYVNIDAAGHLGFFTDEASFLQAAAVCKAKGWGCG